MYTTKENKKGISLIVLVITIIVVIIIAAAVILTLTNNNPIAEARKATFLNDISTFQDDLNMYKTNEYAKRMGEYDPSLLNATSSGLTYNGSAVSGQDNIYDAIPSLEGKTKYSNEFEVESGGIKYVGTNTEKADWAQNEAGIPADVAKPSIEVTTSNTLPVKAGTNVSYTFNIAASSTITETNLTGKIKIINNLGTELVTQPTINIGSVTGTTTEKTVTITVNTTGMAEGTYKIKVLAGAVKTSTQESLEFVIATPFEVDNTAPNMPTITLNPTTSTNGNVTATLTKANAADTLEYSTNGTTWNAYTTALTITSNLTVYARETDSANNVSSQATQIISNIDKAVPQKTTISLTTAGDKINGTITLVDSESGINVSQSKYIVTTQSTGYATTDVVWNSATVMGTTSKSISETKADGMYFVQVLSTDNAGNKRVDVSSSITVSNTPPNAPVLTAGMTPIKWDASGNVVTTTTGDTSWYNYTNKQWANARTADGSMWVWIPRYEYQIPNTHTSTAQTIAINFKSGTNSTASSGYIVHPAFTFGSTELTGIWVAKFEASGTTGSIDIKPNVSSLTTLIINDIFNECINMASNTSKYGWSTTNLDTHLIKNIEWGVVAYLTQSTFGKNSEVWKNPDSNFITGRAGASVNASGTTSTYSYNNSTYGIQASTTGNIYGIYDMNGCSLEYVAGYVNNGNSNLTSFGNSVYTAGSQYKDVYISSGDTESGNYTANSNKKGDAFYETSSSTGSNYAWYSSLIQTPYSNMPFFMRGGSYSNSSSGGIFSVYYYTGNTPNTFGFRPVVVSGTGL